MPKANLLSEYYFKYPEIVSSENRLDYHFWHPKFDDLITTITSSKYQVDYLSKLVNSPIISGKTPKNYVYLMKGIPFIGSRNVRNGYMDLSDVVYVDESVHNGLLKSLKINASDVLVTMAGSIGRCALYKDTKQEANINQAVARIKPKPEKLDPQYLVYYLNSTLGQTQFNRNKHEVNQPNINTTEIGTIKIICPPIEIQTKLVKKLSVMEKEILIMTNKKNNIYQEIRSIISSELELTIHYQKKDYYFKDFDRLGDRFDFVWNHPSTHFIKTLLEKKKGILLSDLLEGEIEYGINAYGKKTGKIPFINIENLDLDGRIHTEEIRYLKKASESKILKENDILISRSRTVGTCGLVTGQEKGYTFGSYILKFRVNPKLVEPFYVACFINSELGQSQIRYLQTGSRDVERGGGNNINPDQLKQMIIVLPDTYELQNEIIKKTKEKLKERDNVDRQLKEKTTIYKTAFVNSIMN